MSTTEPSFTAKAKLLENPSRTVGSPTSTLSTNTCMTPLQPSPLGAFMLRIHVPQVPTGFEIVVHHFVDHGVDHAVVCEQVGHGDGGILHRDGAIGNRHHDGLPAVAGERLIVEGVGRSSTASR